MNEFADYIADIIRLNNIQNMDELNKYFSDKKEKVMNAINAKYTTTEFECLICTHKWQPVFPVGCQQLECPNCHNYSPIN